MDLDPHDEETGFFSHGLASFWTLVDLIIIFGIIYVVTGLIP